MSNSPTTLAWRKRSTASASAIDFSVANWIGLMRYSASSVPERSSISSRETTRGLQDLAASSATKRSSSFFSSIIALHRGKPRSSSAKLSSASNVKFRPRHRGPCTHDPDAYGELPPHVSLQGPRLWQPSTFKDGCDYLPAKSEGRYRGSCRHHRAAGLAIVLGRA